MIEPSTKQVASKNNTLSKLLALLLVFSLLLSQISGCTLASGEKVHKYPENEFIPGQSASDPDNPEQRTVFDIGDELLALICSDYVTYHQLIANPNSFDFPDSFRAPAPSFGEITTDSQEEAYEYFRLLLAELQGFDFQSLSPEEQRTYNYLTYCLESTIALEPYYYLSDPFAPSMGLQINLPITLTTFTFRSKQDIDDYLTLLADLPRFFAEANSLVQDRADQGLFPNLGSVHDAIDEARFFTTKIPQNLLVTSFEDQLFSDSKPFSDLTFIERLTYQATNRKIVDTMVIPAFQETITLLEEIATKTTDKVTLATQAGGQDYYAASMHDDGFTETPEQAIVVLDEALDVLFTTFAKNPLNLDYDEFSRIAAGSIPSDAAGIIEYFNTRVSEDFPDIGMRPFIVDSASDDEVVKLITAFYLDAPIDDLGQNLIRYYPQNIDSLVDLGTTLAHESFPGHLYQYNYFALQNPEPIEIMLGSTAYAEGYAVYSEYYALRYMGFNDQTSELIYTFELFLRVIQARLDLGINYQGWSLQETARFLSKWGLEFIAPDVYSSIAGAPTVFLQYGLAPLEFRAMRSMAQTQLGSSFNLVEFHEVILKDGALPFCFVEQNLTLWLDGQQK